jgi:regulator of replication initiation timing
VPAVKFPEREVIERRLLAYLNQRGAIEATALATALGINWAQMRRARGGTEYAYPKRAVMDRLDEIARQVAPYRTETEAGTVTYHLRNPEKPLFVPASKFQQEVRVTVDPNLKGRWWPGQSVRQARISDNPTTESHPWKLGGPAVVKEEDRKSKIENRKGEVMASIEQTQALEEKFDRILRQLPGWAVGDLTISKFREITGFSNTWLYKEGAGRIDRLKDALEVERQRRVDVAEVEAVKPRIMVEAEDSVEVAEVEAGSAHPTGEGDLPNLAESMADMRRRLSELETRNHELEAQNKVLQEQLQRPRVGPASGSDELLREYRELKQAIAEADKQLEDMQRKRGYLVEDCAALQRALVLLGKLDLEQEEREAA